MIAGYGWRGDIQALQEKSVGKMISNVSLVDNCLELSFEDGSNLKFYDDGQDCCEYRYFSCDGDDLSQFIGDNYIEAFVKDAPNIKEDDEGDDYHEVCFLEVRTSRGTITISAHNEHNGYYGGFGITVSED